MFGRQVTEFYESRDSIAHVWGSRTPYAGERRWPVRIDERSLEDAGYWVPSTCPFCSNGCGMDIGVRDGRIVGVRGRATDRANLGRLGPKGLHGWAANNSPDRLTRPLARTAGTLRPASWEEAMSLLVERSRGVRDVHSPLAMAFYVGGQLFLEEYYTLAVIALAGLGTPHLDSNVRLSTAAASAALTESLGSEAQPGSFDDVDTADAILHVGHNVAEQHTVLWMRILDRRRGPRPPKLVVIDPRRTPTAAAADVHLAPWPGSNVPVLNGLLRLIIEAGRIDRAFVEAHTMGFAALEDMVDRWPPERVEEVSGVPASGLRAAAEILGATPTLLSTVSLGVYQSGQATAAAVQVNNLHLVRGLFGRPGCGVLQMGGQPAGANAHETGCAGALPGFRNWANPAHVAELAQLWNVEAAAIPAWGPSTPIMQMLRYIEEGSIRMLWVIGTNPAVSLPDLLRIRRLLGQEGLFLVVEDGFLNETAEHADLVLPAALWAEKTGTFTSSDRTVHISHTAVSPPGEARPDLAILLDYARRMDLRDRDGAPLVKWRDAAGAFEAWRACSRGRPCDYSGLSYARLSGATGIQWPCNARHPQGAPRLYADGVFDTAAGRCESFGHDLVTGAGVSPADYCAHDPGGRALLKPADYQPPLEVPDADYPLWLTTGRVVYQWLTRTKTARSKELNAAAPEPTVQMAEEDAARYHIADGQLVDLHSRRGRAQVRATLGGIQPGTVFMPFHYGSWDRPGRRAANELTLSEWDPVSKQPHLKYAAVRLHAVPRPATVMVRTLARLATRIRDAAGRALLAVRGFAARVRGGAGARAGLPGAARGTGEATR
ncbi:MAG TPA: molybdopterin-dependent oxidoreductase [Anaerolineae bacterium]|nr:molybdopterin-dependent oxidoreductase [Anaerolineae bacterium]HPL27807.1 molybdopterin-dependent oxidoreductase [Anaerolineae bacterium]